MRFINLEISLIPDECFVLFIECAFVRVDAARRLIRYDKSIFALHFFYEKYAGCEARTVNEGEEICSS